MLALVILKSFCKFTKLFYFDTISYFKTSKYVPIQPNYVLQKPLAFFQVNYCNFASSLGRLLLQHALNSDFENPRLAFCGFISELLSSSDIHNLNFMAEVLWGCCGWVENSLIELYFNSNLYSNLVLSLTSSSEIETTPSSIYPTTSRFRTDLQNYWNTPREVSLKMLNKSRSHSYYTQPCPSFSLSTSSSSTQTSTILNQYVCTYNRENDKMKEKNILVDKARKNLKQLEL